MKTKWKRERVLRETERKHFLDRVLDATNINSWWTNKLQTKEENREIERDREREGERKKRERKSLLSFGVNKWMNECLMDLIFLSSFGSLLLPSLSLSPSLPLSLSERIFLLLSLPLSFFSPTSSHSMWINTLSTFDLLPSLSMKIFLSFFPSLSLCLIDSSSTL